MLLNNEHWGLEYHLPIGPVADPVPTFIQPPFAGRDHTVTDNLVRKCQEAGRHVYRFILHSAMPWSGTPFTIEDFVGAIDTCQEHIRLLHDVRWLDVVATCQGGWISAIHNAQNPHLYRKHSFSATPINLRTGLGGKIEEYCKDADMDMHRWMVTIFGGVQLGIFQWLPFAMMNPYQAFVNRWHKQANAVMFGSAEEAKKRVSNNLWHDNTMNLRGEWFLWAMENHFIGNHIYDGTATVGDKPVDLGNITCPILVTVGGSDEITLPEQARAIIDKVGSEVKHYKIFDGMGHTGPFVFDGSLQYFDDMFYGEME